MTAGFSWSRVRGRAVRCSGARPAESFGLSCEPSASALRSRPPVPHGLPRSSRPGCRPHHQQEEISISTTYIPHSVTLIELAKATKRTTAEVEDELRQLAIFTGTDWAGLAAVSEVDAQQIVSGDARRAREDEAAWRAHLDACEAWTRTRDELVREAQAEAELTARRAGRGGGDAAQAGVEAGRSVGADYETNNPVPSWNGEPDGNARRLFSDDGRHGLLGRALDLLAGAPR